MSGGKLRSDIKAGQVTAWLKEDFELGHGHAMAIVALLKGTKKEGDAWSVASLPRGARSRRASRRSRGS